MRAVRLRFPQVSPMYRPPHKVGFLIKKNVSRQCRTRHSPMDTENKSVVSDVDISEHEKVATGKDEERRAELISYLGLTDDETNKPLIDKFFTREKGLRSGYGKLLGSFKELKKGSGSSPAAPKNDAQSAFDVEKFRSETEAALRTKFDDEFLEEFNYSDKLKAEVRDYAKLKNLSARGATKADYIKSLMEKEDAERKAAEAANNGDGAGKSGKDGETGMPEKFTNPAFMITPEGQKEFAEWLASQKK